MDRSSVEPPSSPPIVSTSFTTKIPTKLGSPQSPKLPRLKRRRDDDQGYQSASSGADVSSGSSDAPFFSSDDLGEADAVKYVSPQRKKQYRRAWYEPEEEDSAISYRSMRVATKRPVDSGVYMNSDSSNSSSSEGFELETANLKSKAAQTQSKKMQAFFGTEEKPRITSQSSSFSQYSKSADEKSADEKTVESIITKCIEDGKEEIDLSGLGLTHLADDCFSRLEHFVKEPKFQPEAYTEAACTPLTPKLKLYLGTNQLRSLPSSLFDLTSLTVLSLRNNDLTEIPSAIVKLENLSDLNITGNPLRYLPWELLLLSGEEDDEYNMEGNLKRFGWRCRMLYEPSFEITEKLLSKIPIHQSCRNQGCVQPTVVYRTTPTLFEIDGSVSPLSQSRSPTAAGFRSKDIKTLPLSPPKFEFTPAPSLFDLCLRSCVASANVSELNSYLPSDTSPRVEKALNVAQHVANQEGPEGRMCTVCLELFVVAKAEWLEFFYTECSYNDRPGRTTNFLPYLRRVCSWRCAQEVGGFGEAEHVDIPPWLNADDYLGTA